ncbi:zinc finger protein 3 homolog [Condylostylus longicornis]|uniref:zinc finger protein 3 homolog n=1 Tax=Condylostylus longicornis TaxID=2530218 RepID=UPI00244E3F2C|nr:zinc finger protein 3 homolog [Condylostylus longicornis]
MEFIGLFKCNFCPSNLHDIESLITHFSIQHLNKELFECEACCIKFWKIPDYYEHRNKLNSTCGGKYGITMKSFFHTIKSLFESLPKTEDTPLQISTETSNDIKFEINLNEERPSNTNISLNTSNIPDVGKSEKAEVIYNKNEISTYSEIESSICEDKFEHDSSTSLISHEIYRSKLRNSKDVRKITSKPKWKPKKRKLKIRDTKINKKSKKETDKVAKVNVELVNENDRLIENKSQNVSNSKILENCKICEKSFNNPDELRKHLENHGNDRNELCVCHVCNKKFNSVNYLKVHISSKHPNDLFCTKCNKHFSNQEMFDVHINEFHKINRNNNKSKALETKTLECFECTGRVFTRVSSFVMHLSNKHKKSDEEIKQILEINNETFKNELMCKICGKLFVTIDHLMNHQKRKHGTDGKNQHKCKSCSKFFASQEEVRSHILECHKEKLMCPICNNEKIYSCTESLIGHKRRIHKIYNRPPQQINTKEQSGNESVDIKKKKVYKFVCGQCGKIMNGRTQFKNHEASNCGKNPVHKCNVCGKGFASAGILKGHVSIHEDYESYQFVCDFCQKRYRTKHQLTKHRRIHTGERPFQCPHCEKAFGTSAALFVHISTHTGVKRYMCTCGERFSCITGLKGHWKTNSTTCGSDPNKSTKAVGEYIGYRKGKVVNIRPEEEMMMRPSL